MNMRERIARALYDDDDADVPRFGWDHDKGLHGRYLAKADAVLAVLREPTPEMIAAVRDNALEYPVYPEADWRTMIEAAAISPPEGMGEEKE